MPEVASDSTVTDVPAPIFTCFGVLKNTFNGEVWSLESAVANPLTPVKLAPEPTNEVAVNTPVTTAPEPFACTLTLPPAVSFNEVTSIPVKLAPVIDPLTFKFPTTSSA